jgi:hypothetical protein
MHSIRYRVAPDLFQQFYTDPDPRNLCGLHIFVYIAFTEVHLNAARRAAAAFCYKCSVVSSHVLDYFVDHLNLWKQTLGMCYRGGEKHCVSVDENRDANRWEARVVRTNKGSTKVKLTSSGQWQRSAISSILNGSQGFWQLGDNKYMNQQAIQ